MKTPVEENSSAQTSNTRKKVRSLIPNRILRRCLSAPAALTRMIALCCGLAYAQANSMTDLGTLGGTYSYASVINDNGQVVGEANTGDGAAHAFVWDAVNGMTDLGTLGGTHSYATAINANGQVVGSAFPAGDGEYHAFVWDAVNA